MKIIDFTAEHTAQAAKLAARHYGEERAFVPLLPASPAPPDLARFADNGFGVAAFEGDGMVGFLCSVPPFQNAFGSTDAVGVFSPMGANAALRADRARIYARMYQAAGEKWARAGASSHAVCLYAHDEAALGQFFRYGFGQRCVDALRGMDEIAAPDRLEAEGYEFSEPGPEEVPQMLELENLLDESCIDSPFFMRREKMNEAEFLRNYEKYRSVYAAARFSGRYVAFMRAELDGETFIQNTPGYLHVKGAYCLPEHRGKGINQRLLNMLTRKLRASGYTRLGVDFESINPSGSGFWLKYFSAYSCSVVRRIDGHALF